MTLAMEVFAPNGTVRKRVRDQRNRYVRLIGEPAPAQRMIEQLVLRKARRAIKREREMPLNFRPKEEPFKRYDYHRRGVDGGRPYDVTHPRRELSYQMYDWSRRARSAVVGGLVKTLRGMRNGHGEFTGQRMV
jgi:hypothetical protein